MAESSNEGMDWQKELEFYKKKLNELSGESIRYDYLLSSLRYELKQRKDGFAVLTRLQTEFTVATPLETLFSVTLKAINTHLSMDKSVILTANTKKNIFQAGYWQGYYPAEAGAVSKAELAIPAELLKEGSSLLVNKSVNTDELMENIRKIFFLNYFVGVPVFHEETPIAFIIAGRMFEKVPFNHALNMGDVDTLIAIAALVGAVLQNKNVAELREEMIKQKEENTLISSMLAELKATQAQLIQSEKMASLGELTAGIAHEIQNPLNFVNNFSEISKELLDEMKTALDGGDAAEAKDLADDVIQNLEKINHHGRRADAIVKSMLQHSRTSSGKKEMIDLNLLVEEYIRLGFHGWRAKDKNFTVKVETSLDKTVKPTEVVPQEIGRVLLNLVNNAFYAVNEKKKTSKEEYEPTVKIITKQAVDNTEIRVIDNGDGIPPDVFDKIFQPFFTTKPTGQGTGLGLSLSYDIITKGHGGEMKVETKDGKGTAFIILLPAK